MSEDAEERIKSTVDELVDANFEREDMTERLRELQRKERSEAEKAQLERRIEHGSREREAAADEVANPGLHRDDAPYDG